MVDRHTGSSAADLRPDRAHVVAAGRQLGAHGARRPHGRRRAGATRRSEDQPGRLRRRRVSVGPGDRGAHHHAAGGVDGAQPRLAVVRAAASVHARPERGPHAPPSADRRHAAVLRGGRGTHRSAGRDRRAGARRSCHHDPLELGHRLPAVQSGGVDSFRSFSHGGDRNAGPPGGRHDGLDHRLSGGVDPWGRGRLVRDHGRRVQRGRVCPLQCATGGRDAIAARDRFDRASADLSFACSPSTCRCR